MGTVLTLALALIYSAGNLGVFLHYRRHRGRVPLDPARALPADLDTRCPLGRVQVDRPTPARTTGLCPRDRRRLAARRRHRPDRLQGTGSRGLAARGRGRRPSDGGVASTCPQDKTNDAIPFHLPSSILSRPMGSHRPRSGRMIEGTGLLPGVERACPPVRARSCALFGAHRIVASGAPHEGSSPSIRCPSGFGGDLIRAGEGLPCPGASGRAARPRPAMQEGLALFKEHVRPALSSTAWTATAARRPRRNSTCPTASRLIESGACRGGGKERASSTP